MSFIWDIRWNFAATVNRRGKHPSLINIHHSIADRENLWNQFVCVCFFLLNFLPHLSIYRCHLIWHPLTKFKENIHEKFFFLRNFKTSFLEYHSHFFEYILSISKLFFKHFECVLMKKKINLVTFVPKNSKMMAITRNIRKSTFDTKHAKIIQFTALWHPIGSFICYLHFLLLYLNFCSILFAFL